MPKSATAALLVGVRFVGSMIVAALAGSLALTPFGVSYFGVIPSGALSSLLIVAYAMPVMLSVLFVAGPMYAWVAARYHHSSPLLPTLIGAVAGGLAPYAMNLNNPLLGGLICAFSGGITALTWAALLKRVGFLTSH